MIYKLEKSEEIKQRTLYSELTMKSIRLGNNLQEKWHKPYHMSNLEIERILQGIILH